MTDFSPIYTTSAEVLHYQDGYDDAYARFKAACQRTKRTDDILLGSFQYKNPLRDAREEMGRSYNAIEEFFKKYSILSLTPSLVSEYNVLVDNYTKAHLTYSQLGEERIRRQIERATKRIAELQHEQNMKLSL